MDKPQATPDTRPIESAARVGAESHGCTMKMARPIKVWTRPIKNTKDFGFGRYLASKTLSAAITTENRIVLPIANKMDNAQPLHSVQKCLTTWELCDESIEGAFSYLFIALVP